MERKLKDPFNHDSITKRPLTKLVHKYNTTLVSPLDSRKNSFQHSKPNRTVPKVVTSVTPRPMTIKSQRESSRERQVYSVLGVVSPRSVLEHSPLSTSNFGGDSLDEDIDKEKMLNRALTPQLVFKPSPSTQVLPKDSNL